jgi:AbiU2
MQRSAIRSVRMTLLCRSRPLMVSVGRLQVTFVNFELSMNTQTVETILKDYLLYGIAKEIFFADEAKLLVVEIGKYAETLNAQGFGRLFGSLQVAYSDRQTLCVTKMFDSENTRYPTRSIPAILNLIENNSSIWTLPQAHQLHKTLTDTGQDRQYVETLNNAQLSLAIVSHFRSTLPQVQRAGICSLSKSLIALREARDKVIAHNEAIAQSARTYPTWGDAEALVTYAKNFLVTIRLC